MTLDLQLAVTIQTKKGKRARFASQMLACNWAPLLNCESMVNFKLGCLYKLKNTNAPPELRVRGQLATRVPVHTTKNMKRP